MTDIKEECCHFNIYSDKSSYSINESERIHMGSFFNISNKYGFRHTPRKKIQLKSVKSVKSRNTINLHQHQPPINWVPTHL